MLNSQLHFVDYYGKAQFSNPVYLGDKYIFAAEVMCDERLEETNGPAER